MPGSRIQLRLATVMLASVPALTVGLLVGGQLPAAGAPSAGSRCPRVAFYGVRGSGEKQDAMGSVITPLAAHLRSDLAGTVTVATAPVRYPAVSVLDAIDYVVAGGVSYPESRIDGIVSLGAALVHEYKRCPSTRTVLAGYSQGADVVATYLANDATPKAVSRIAGVALFGDPRFNPADKAVDAGSFNSRYGPLYGRFGVPPDWRHPEGRRPDIASGLAGRTISVCNKGDLVCNYSWSNAVGCFAVNAWANYVASILLHQTVVVPEMRASCAHFHYSDKGPAVVPHGQKVTVTAVAQFLAAEIRKAVLPSRWSAAAAPLPAGAVPGSEQFPYSDAIACPSVSWCIAVGMDADSSGHSQGLLLMKSRSAWTAATAPLPAGAPENSNVDLTSVACSSASWCVAVGVYSYGTQDVGLILTWSGKAWTALKAPLPPPHPGNQSRDGDLVSVACPSASSCVAVGTYAEYDPVAGEEASRGLLLRWSGRSWTATQPPLPAGAEPGSATFTLLNADVACASASWCTAIGEYGDTSSTEQGLLLTWSGNRWTAAKAPTPPGTNLSQGRIDLVSVACPSASSCTVAGGYQDSSGQSHGLILTGAGSAWTPIKTTHSWWSVACASVSSCTIGGDGAILVGARAHWKTINAPPAAAGTLLASVACPATSLCAAVAESPLNDGLQIAAGGGSDWTAFDVVPAGGINGEALLTTIACPSTSTCVAVGDLSGASGGVVATGPS